MWDLTKKKRGRPPTGEVRTYGYRVRLTEDEAEILDYLSDKLGKSKAEVLRKGLAIQYNLEKFN